MTRFDGAHLRIVAWLVTTGVIILLIYGYQVYVLVSGLNDLLLATLGTVLPAFPFLALLILLTAMRWNEFHQILLTEKGLQTMPLTRLLGLGLIAVPAVIWYIASLGTPSVYVEMEIAAASFVLVAYGTLLAINPSMTKIMLPYALLYVVGLVSPLVMLDLFSGPLIAVSSYLTAEIVDVIGIHVVWQGPAFQLVSASGTQIGAVITPPCSAAYSISIFLALLGLMYLDMRKSVKLTTELGIVGVLLLPVLNSARIALTILSGYYGGTDAFWGIHDWLGYAVFFAFYMIVLVIYSRAPRQARLSQGTSSVSTAAV